MFGVFTFFSVFFIVRIIVCVLVRVVYIAWFSFIRTIITARSIIIIFSPIIARLVLIFNSIHNTWIAFILITPRVILLIIVSIHLFLILISAIVFIVRDHRSAMNHLHLVVNVSKRIVLILFIITSIMLTPSIVIIFAVVVTLTIVVIIFFLHGFHHFFLVAIWHSCSSTLICLVVLAVGCILFIILTFHRVSDICFHCCVVLIWCWVRLEFASQTQPTQSVLFHQLLIRCHTGCLVKVIGRLVNVIGLLVKVKGLLVKVMELLGMLIEARRIVGFNFNPVKRQSGCNEREENMAMFVEITVRHSYKVCILITFTNFFYEGEFTNFSYGWEGVYQLIFLLFFLEGGLPTFLEINVPTTLKEKKK
uniref:Uncharacterized protein n=1 Tax=Cacopsylla melanoneura TaxID=428564 RepID=A0A8D8RQ49_9HEMI